MHRLPGVLRHNRLSYWGPHRVPLWKAAAKACCGSGLAEGRATHLSCSLSAGGTLAPEGHQVSIVGGRGMDTGACAAHVGVAQLVGEDLQLMEETVSSQSTW